ncbi:MFS general substrate transporter [Apiospora saccharicola]|uniref:MFS general substrate transporter n=1 Tax=Apiospora saccharicola TaxID=335842 RepID=A0ABR1VBS8_9PEZI
MSSLHLQSTMFGQLMRLASGNRLFKYPDEIDPSLWKQAVQPNESVQSDQSREPSTPSNKEDLPDHVSPNEHPDGSGDVVLVDWYGPDDPEARLPFLQTNPHNYPRHLKVLIMMQMCILNFAVYIASSIYVPGEELLMEEFGVSVEVATLGLSLFTLGYGMGPMLWSPLSEMPRFGRSGIFFWTLLGFILFQLPAGFAPNIAVFLVFRWVTGFCGSPCLATGGGTITDVFDPTVVPYLLCTWVSTGIWGPVFGPIIGGYLAPARGWRWTIWFFTWLCSLVLIVMFFLFPETSTPNILLKRAQRMPHREHAPEKSFRDRPGASHDEGLSDDFGEVSSRNRHMARCSGKARLTPARAFTLLREPIVLLVDLYSGLLYGILFTWFESFPLVFGSVYGFDLGPQGLVYLSIFVFAVLTQACYLLWQKFTIVPHMRKGDFKPEMVLPPTIFGAVTLPICLFWFGWSAKASIHWMVPTVGSGLFSIGVITLYNALYTYIGICYSQYAASLFAGATLFRALFGATFPLFVSLLPSNYGWRMPLS